MFRSKTVFVLGAGSSEEVGLPVGSELKEKIARHIDIRFDEWGRKQESGNRDIVEALQRKTTHPNGLQGDINPYLHAAWKIRDALPQAISIDNFLDSFNDDAKIELVGKLGIVASILAAEKSSSIYVNERNDANIDFLAQSGTWFAGFTQLLTEGIRKKQIKDIFNNIAIINFNYDRCVEHYLFHSLCNYYGLTQREAGDQIADLQIMHPYGTVGKLYRPGMYLGDDLRYGSDRCDLLAASEQIKTFTEKIQDQTSLEEIKNTIQSAETMVFLGFAFHRQNLELLKPSEAASVKRIFATAFGMSKSDCGVVEGELRGLFKRNADQTRIEFRNDLKCGQLFSEYWRSLSA